MFCFFNVDHIDLQLRLCFLGEGVGARVNGIVSWSLHRKRSHTMYTCTRYCIGLYMYISRSIDPAIGASDHADQELVLQLTDKCAHLKSS